MLIDDILFSVAKGKMKHLDIQVPGFFTLGQCPFSLAEKISTLDTKQRK